jgi:TrmH family RNA methyltransferase
MILTHNERALYRSLKQKKERERTGLFVVDGIKPVKEALTAAFPLERILISANIDETERLKIQSLANSQEIAISIVTQSEIEQISALRNPEGVLAIAKIPSEVNLLAPLDYPALYLWQINDPGNLGTILRTALWFDVKTILLSPDSVDVYSPKVVRGAMGALFRLKVRTEVDLSRIEMILGRDNAQMWAADMSGVIEKPKIANDRFIIALGSESHGLPPEILQHAVGVIRINKYGYGESLNVAVAVGIILNTIRQK